MAAPEHHYGDEGSRDGRTRLAVHRQQHADGRRCGLQAWLWMNRQPVALEPLDGPRVRRAGDRGGPAAPRREQLDDPRRPAPLLARDNVEDVGVDEHVARGWPPPGRRGGPPVIRRRCSPGRPRVRLATGGPRLGVSIPRSHRIDSNHSPGRIHGFQTRTRRSPV